MTCSRSQGSLQWSWSENLSLLTPSPGFILINQTFWLSDALAGHVQREHSGTRMLDLEPRWRERPLVPLDLPQRIEAG